jgi:phosphonoacetaldehyde hydrolase
MDFVFRRSYRGPIKLAIFDWAGTTMDYGCLAPAVVFIDVFKLRGVEITMEQARAPMGLMKKDHIRAISKADEVAAAWRKVHGRDCTEQDVADMFEKDFKRLQVQCIADYSKLIPGTLEAMAEVKKRGIKTGSTTGYFTEAMEINHREAKKQGYCPDSNVCASDVPAGRPEPWMVLANMQATRTFPPEAVVKIGDTQPDIGEGLNAGVWTIGLSRTGNEVGLSEEDCAKLAPDVLQRKVARATDNLLRCGAHYVVETIGDVPPLIDLINERLRAGDRP